MKKLTRKFWAYEEGTKHVRIYDSMNAAKEAIEGLERANGRSWTIESKEHWI